MRRAYWQSPDRRLPSSVLARPSRIARAPNPLSLNLVGRRLKGKGKEVLGPRETQGLAPKTPFPFPFKRLPRGLCNAPVLFLFAISLSKSRSVACVASVSNRVIAPKLERKQKKGWRGRGRGEEEVPSFPSPFSVIHFCFALVPVL